MDSHDGNRALSGPDNSGYEQAAADPKIPVVSKDDYIEHLEQQLAIIKKATRRAILGLVRVYGEKL